MEKNEEIFYNKLKNIFIGAIIKGNSGFVNLMRIKSSYFDIIFKELNNEINNKVSQDFKEEMFDKLNTFFSIYFSESGSIYFSYTPLKSKVYDKIYTQQDDVVLFWKTRMLYYVKTDKLWNNLTIDYDKDDLKYKIQFDVSKLEHKSGNEKKDIIYELNTIKGQDISFYTLYSEKGRGTKNDEILKEFKMNKINLYDEDLNKMFSIFERQNDVDYFINKDAKSFLREQFDIWLKNYIFDDESDFSEKRIKELKLLKGIAFKIIDFVSQFEDELVKIWNKPKFVLNSNYVITFDRIIKRDNGIDIIREIINNKYFDKQVEEWKDLNMVDNEFDKNHILIENNNAYILSKKYQFLPVDTKYFKDIELDILSLFDNLDDSLDGWLIHSENYQALNTILPKFKEKVQTIYIDPPFNKESNADYFYNVKYKDASWTTLLENRISLAKNLLNEKGSIFVRCDHNGNYLVRPLMNQIFGSENFRNEIIINRTQEFFKNSKGLNKYLVDTDSLILFVNNYSLSIFNEYKIKRKNDTWWEPFLPGKSKNEKDKYRIIKGKTIEVKNGRKWGLSQETINELEKFNKIRVEKNVIKYSPLSTNLKNNWTVLGAGYARNWEFPTENSEIILKPTIYSTSNNVDLVLDFFLGSGTTTAVAHKLHRKWIGVEMGDHFYTVVMPRMKRVLFYDKSGISKDEEIKNEYNENDAGGFFKYYDLEQYEQILRRCHYIPSEPFFDMDDKSIYEQYVFMKDPKLLDSMEIDYDNNKIKVNFNNIYNNNIDLAETLSNLKGKYIKKINEDSVTFQDNETIKFDEIDFKTIKPLMWW